MAQERNFLKYVVLFSKYDLGWALWRNTRSTGLRTGAVGYFDNYGIIVSHTRDYSNGVSSVGVSQFVGPLVSTHRVYSLA
jgi:hypothetical protein